MKTSESTIKSHPAVRAIEALESRIAPAAVFTFTESDGDLVTVTSSKGDDAALAAAVNVSGGSQYIERIDLTAAVFAGTNLKVTAERGGLGDGFTAVGFLDATGNDLGKVNIRGDLAKIVAGDADDTFAGVKNLTVQSMGRYNVNTGAPDLDSVVTGNWNKLNVEADVRGANISADSFNSIQIGGSLLGNAADNSGRIFAVGRVEKVMIGGDLAAGAGAFTASITAVAGFGTVTIEGSLLGEGTNSARISTLGKIDSLAIGGNILGGTEADSGAIFATELRIATINGSVVGGSGADSGSISVSNVTGAIRIDGDLVGGLDSRAGSVVVNDRLDRIAIGGSVIGGLSESTGRITAQEMGRVRIDGNLIGSFGTNSGSIFSGGGAGTIEKVRVGGSVIGGLGDISGSIRSDGELTTLQIGGDLIGASITGADDLDGSGYIRVGRIVSGTIEGSIIAGEDNSTGTLEKSGSIRVFDDIGSLVIGGSLVGTTTNAVIIAAEGVENKSKGAIAIGNLEIGGSVEFAQILAGYDLNLNPTDGDTSIGTVKVGGDWRGSDLVAGVEADPGGVDPDDEFGNADDAVIAGNDAALFARIAKIVIKGQVLPSSAVGDRFGFVAQEIGSFRLGGALLPLQAGVSNDVISVGSFTDATIREVA